MGEVKLDEIDYWTEVKLDIVRKYAQAYSTIINKNQIIRKHMYIDGFSGTGLHISKNTGEYILGSPLNALNIIPPFSELHYVDLNTGKAQLLQEATSGMKNVFVYEGDCNKVLLEEVFPRARREDYHRALCLLDPYGLHLDWQIVYTAGRMGSIEIFLNFPVMDMNMNVLWHHPEKVRPDQLARMDAFWGDRSWKNAAYIKTRGLFQEITEKVNIKKVASAYRERLMKIAGFKYVPKPIPMRNNNGAIIYYLFFASPNKTGAKIVGEIYDKYRDRGIS